MCHWRALLQHVSVGGREGRGGEFVWVCLKRAPLQHVSVGGREGRGGVFVWVCPPAACVSGGSECVREVMYGWVCPSPPLPPQMTASGLGARYASLPTEKECFDDVGWWHLLREGELLGAVPELKGMLQLLEFCDSVVKVGWMCEWGCGMEWVGVRIGYVLCVCVCICGWVGQ